MNENNINYLLTQYFKGKTTQEETSEISNWINSSEENQNMANRVRETIFTLDYMYVERNIKADKDFNKISQRVFGDKHRKTIKLSDFINWGFKIASILLLPLIIGLIYIYSNKHDNVIIKSSLAEFRTAPGMTASLTLPDSSSVILNCNSVLKYEIPFGQDNKRVVELEGEAFFNVTKSEKNKFIVKSKKSEITVYGTSFNVSSYKDDDILTATLKTGKIKFSYLDSNSKPKEKFIAPNQKIVYNDNIGSIKIYKTNCVDEISWIDGKIAIENMSLENVLHILNRLYTVDFVVKNKKAKSYKFTGTISTRELNSTLNMMSVSSSIRWKYIDTDSIQNKTIEIF